MIPQKITELAEYRARKAKPVADALAWHSAFETVFVANLTAALAWQRTIFRAVFGV